jgi:single-strand DNA-binding protein
MANDINQCNFIGRLGSDPETRYTSNGDPVCTISIACGWKSKDKEGVEWIPVTAFGKLAEIMGKYLTKGSQVFISGRFKTDQYEKDSVKKYNTKIVADRMQMLGGNNVTQSNQQTTQQSNVNQESGGSPCNDFDDGIPFASYELRSIV